jgi:hypothetical protein
MRLGPWGEYEADRRGAQESGGRVFALVVSAGLAFLAARHFFWPEPIEEPASQVREPQSAAPVVREVRELPAEPARPSERRPVPRPSSKETVKVYECYVNGQLVLSDQRCAENARERVVDVTRPNPTDAAMAQYRLEEQKRREAYRSSPPPRRSSTGQSGAGSSYGAGNASRCARIDQRIEWINSRMRQGYTSQEGEWLREDLRRLKQERWDARCGR